MAFINRYPWFNVLCIYYTVGSTTPVLHENCKCFSYLRVRVIIRVRNRVSIRVIIRVRIRIIIRVRIRVMV